MSLSIPVKDAPAICLGNWSVVEINGSHYFVGQDLTDHEGRVSTKIVRYDLNRKIGTTLSGRRYHLIGEHINPEGNVKVFQDFKKIHNIKQYRNVSELYI